MSSTPPWRTFKLFETQVVTCSEISQGAAICCCAMGASYFATGDVVGGVSLYDRRSFVLCVRFQAYLGTVTQLKFVQTDGGQTWLCALGNDTRTVTAAATNESATQVAILRLWRLDDVFLSQHRIASSIVATVPHTMRSGGRDGAISDVSGDHSNDADSSNVVGTQWSGNVTGTSTIVPPHREHRVFLEEADNGGRGAAAMDRAAVPPQPPVTSTATYATAGNQSGDAATLCDVIVGFDITPDLRNAAVGLANQECLLLHGELAHTAASTTRLRRRWLHSGVARGRLTLVAFPTRTRVQVASAMQPPPVARNTSGVPSSSSSLAAVVSLATTGSLLHRGVTRPGSPSVVSVRASPGQVGGDVAGANAAMQVLYLAYDDAVTVWTVKDGGAVHEHRCPMPWGAPPRVACVLEGGTLAVLNRDGTQIACLGLPEIQRTEAVASASVTRSYYDPTVAGNVRVVSLVPSHQPGCGSYTVVGYRDYVVVLSRPSSQQQQRLTNDGHFALQCYDVQHALRGLSRGQDRYEHVAFVLAGMQDILLVLAENCAETNNGVTAIAASSPRRVNTLVRLTELELPARLELLFRRECYDIAVSLAMSAEPAVRRGVAKRYADYLYAKGKLAEAMKQYIDKIDQLEPSYVIQRYLSTEHLTLLITYLEALHAPQRTSSSSPAMAMGLPVALQTSHTTLLLQCYLKCGERERLRTFVHRDNVRLDAASAIAVCRQGGDYATALYIAERYALAAAYVEIEFYDRHRPHAALRFVRRLSVDVAEALLGGNTTSTSRAMGKDFLRAVPAAMTALLIELCVHWSGPARRLPRCTPATVMGVVSGGEGWLDDQVSRPTHRALASQFIPILHDMPVCLFHFLRAVTESGVLDEGAEVRRRGNASHATKPHSSSVTDVHKTAPLATTCVDIAGLADSAVPLYNTLCELYMTPILSQDYMSDDEDEPAESEPDGDVDRAAGEDGNDDGNSKCNVTTNSELTRRASMTDDKIGNNSDLVTTKAATKSKGSFTPLSIDPLELRRVQARIFLENYIGHYDAHTVLALSLRFDFDDGVIFLLQQLGWWDELIHFYEGKISDRATSTDAATKEAVVVHNGGAVAVTAENRSRQTAETDSVTRQNWAAALVQACFTAEEVAMTANSKQAAEEEGQEDVSHGGSGSSDREVAVTDRVRAMWLLGVSSLLHGHSAVTPNQLSLVLEHVIASPGLLNPTLMLELFSGVKEGTTITMAERARCEKMQQHPPATEGQSCRIERHTTDCVRELAKLQRECDALQSEALVFASPLCAQCGQPLDLPATYFFCHHAFHRRCLNVATECNLCGAEQHCALDALDQAVLLANEATRAMQTVSTPASTDASGAMTGGPQQSAATRMSVMYASLIGAPRATCSTAAIMAIFDEAVEEDAIQTELIELW